jgi:hypothetical protein
MNRWLYPVSLLVVSVPALASEPKAFIRQEGNRFYVAIYSGGQVRHGAVPSDFQAMAFQNGKPVSTDVDVNERYGADFRLFLKPESLGGNFKDLTVAVMKAPLADGTNVGFLVDASFDWTAKLTVASPGCKDQFALTFEADTAGSDKYQTLRLPMLKKSLAHSPATIDIEEESAVGIRSYSVSSTRMRATQDLLVACEVSAAQIPKGQYDVRVRYSDPDLPVELRQFMVKTELRGNSIAAAPAEVNGDAVTKRPLEQNLDLGLQFASSIKTDTTTGVESRDNKGSFDIRLAPFLNTIQWSGYGNDKPLIRFFTPFGINAQVSTGSITTDTLSTNTIKVSSEYEWRKYYSLQTHPTFMRHIASINNYSDRDLKNAEITGKFEFLPHFARLDHPLAWRTAAVGVHQIDPDPDRGPKIVRVTQGFGYSVIPSISFEAGGQYRDKSTLAPFDRSDYVARLAVGGTAKFDLTSYVSVSLQDTLYIRGESSVDRTHNYFKSSIEAPLHPLLSKSAATLFLSFERGALPPFSTPDVNSVTLGIRVQATGWFDEIR